MTNSPSGKIRLLTPAQPKDLGEALYKAFMEAIYVLFQQGYTISGLKLLLSALDTMAFLTTGNGNSGTEFKAWLAKYVDLESVGIDADELWAHRSALLHMTNFHSKSVNKGAVKFLIPALREAPQEFKDPVKSKIDALYGTNYKFYSVQKLFEAVFVGFDIFLAEIDSNHDLKAVVISSFGEVVPDIPIAVTRTR